MTKEKSYDLTYITIDSLSEGVGSSQIVPLISRLSEAGLRINLISFEKEQPSAQLLNYLDSAGVSWNPRAFGPKGLLGGMHRLNELRSEIQNTDLIHARSDIPAVSGIASRMAPVLWDVRSLWADQKVLLPKNRLEKNLYRSYRILEHIAASKSMGMSTLTHAVIPILEERNSRLPLLRTVVPTAVDLSRFKFSPSFPKVARALFSGTYSNYYDLDLSLRFVNELKKLTSLEVHWARPQESNKQHLGVGEERIIPLTQSQMADIIPNYSFGVSICKLNAGPSLKGAMPTKIAEFLACGRPIVVNFGLGDMDQLIGEFDVGVVLNGEEQDLQKNAKKLIRLLRDPETPQRCRDLAEKHFNMDVGAKKYLELYKKIMESKLDT
jgi:glycosyltransferase involved in cell wall biosynthesis